MAQGIAVAYVEFVLRTSPGVGARRVELARANRLQMVGPGPGPLRSRARAEYLPARLLTALEYARAERFGF